MSEGSWEGPPKKSSGATKWILIGCGAAAVLGLMLCGGVGLIVYFAMRGASATVDDVYTQALASGDAGAAYANADPRFKQFYREEDVASLIRDHLGLTRRDQLTAKSVKTITRDGETYELVLVSVGAELNASLWAFACTRGGDGKLRLLGVEPIYSEAVPHTVREELQDMFNFRERDWDD